MAGMRRLGLAVGVLLLVTACGGGSSFADDDPHGYEACSLFAKSQKETDGANKIGGLGLAGEEASQASTKAIRESSDAMFDEDAMDALEGTESAGKNFFFADPKKLKAACSDAGFEF